MKITIEYSSLSELMAAGELIRAIKSAPQVKGRKVEFELTEKKAKPPGKSRAGRGA